MRLSILLFLILPLTLPGQEILFPGTIGDALLDSLVANFKPTGALSYSDARNHMFRTIDNEGDSVRCIYTDHAVYLPPGEPEPIQFLLMNNNPNGINTEHLFPQSQGAENGNARADLHHLRPARVRVNESRGSFPFGEIADVQTEHWYYRSQDLSQPPGAMIDLFSEQINGRFEPREGKKGDVARSMMYFMTMYAATANPVFFEEQRAELCAWHYQDPADEAERSRNAQVADFQEGKANPFILDCTVADRTFCQGIDQCKPSATGSVAAMDLRVFPNPAYDRLWLEGDMDFPVSVIIRSATGVAVAHVLLPESGAIDLGDLPAGLYFLEAINKDGGRAVIPFVRVW